MTAPPTREALPASDALGGDDALVGGAVPVVARARCANCDVPLAGAYCHGCGQAAADPLVSLGALGTHAAEALLSWDARLLASARALLTRPGRMTADVLAGRRARYVGPVQLYAASAALLFLAGTVRPLVTFDPRTRWFRSGLSGLVGFANRLTDGEVARLAARGISLDVFRERFVATATAQLSTLLLLSVPAFALAVALLHAWPRAARRPLPHHVVFALHWSAFFLLVAAALQLVPVHVPRAVGMSLGLATLAVTLAYLVVALRRTYGAGWAATGARAAVLIVLYHAILLTWLESVVQAARRGI